MQILINDSIDTSFDEKFFQSIINIVSEYIKIQSDCELSILLTNDPAIQELNNQYRGKNTPTDVLAFPMDDIYMLGDIVISIDTMKRQAQEAGISPERETAFLFIHGFLHLMGFDHENSEEEADDMYDMQETILAKWEEERAKQSL